MSDRIEALARRLVADMEITRSMGREISPDGQYGSVSCSVCLLGCVMVAAHAVDEEGTASEVVGRLMSISVAEADCLEWGFCWPDSEGDKTHPDFFALGKRLREDVLAQRTVPEASPVESVVSCER